MDKDARSQLGDFRDLTAADVVTLGKTGENDILRIRG